MGGNPLTMQVAEKALAKLGADDVTPKGAAHPMYAIYHEGRLVASTGLRRSSKRDILVPHVKTDLRVNAQFVLGLAQCPKSKKQWLQAQGIIPEDEQNAKDNQGEKREP